MMTKVCYWEIANFKTSTPRRDEFLRSGDFLIDRNHSSLTIQINPAQIEVNLQCLPDIYAMKSEIVDVTSDENDKKNLKSFVSLTHTSYFKLDEIFKEAKRYIKDDKLKIRIKIIRQQSDKLSLVKFGSCVDQKRWSQKFQNLLNSNIFSDVYFVCSDGKQIPAHRSILAVNSAVFQAMFNTGMTENISGVINVDDIEGDVMMEVLRYIYTEEVENMKLLSAKILYGAEKYELNSLKNKCEAYLRTSTTAETAIENLILADRFALKSLLTTCIDIVKENYEKIRAHENWKDLNNDQLSLIMDSIQKDAQNQHIFYSCIPSFTKHVFNVYGTSSSDSDE